MLEQSILGKLYRIWVSGAVFGLLQRLFRPVLAVFRGSAIIRVLLRENRTEACYQRSGAARLINGLFRRFTAALGSLRCLVTAADDSAILRVLRGSVLRGLVSFEGLLGAFCFVMFAVPHKYWNNLFTVLAAFAFLLLFLLLAAAGRRKPLAPAGLGLGAALFLLALVLSLGFSAAPGDSLRILLFFLASLALCYVVAADFQSPDRLRILLGWLYAALLVVSLYGIAQNALHLVKANASFTDLELNKGVPGRVYSTLDNPINLSEFILLFLPLGAAFAAGAKQPWKQLLLVLGLAFPALALVLTYSRGGWIAIMLAALVFTWLCNKRLLPVLAVLAICAVPLLPASVVTRLSTIGSTKDSSTLHRLNIWQGVLRLLGDHDRFLTGISLGPETFRRVYPFYSLGKAKVGAYHTQMHYLELVTEAGVLALISFLYMMFKYLGRAGQALRSGLRAHRLVLIACISSVAALAFVGLVEYLWFYPRIMFAFFLFLGILLAAAAPTAEPET